ncbi:MAG: tetratricopeptide repeat protein [Elusimicrobia bacterium]|nr:tetratricopeptide repeat protein [Elusimicrobiota bacterium]
MSVRGLLAAALALAFSLPEAARAKDAELSRRIQYGIDAIYRMEFDECERTFEALLKDFPGLPQAYFGLATASWARFEYEEEQSNVGRHAEFERRIGQAIAKGQDWLKARPDDAEGLVCVSGMYGLRSRLAMMLHKWLRAYLDGTKAVRLTRRALELDPRLYDVYTGLGMWDYYTDTLPGVIKALGRIVAIRGNAKRGVEQLSLAAEKGEHTATAAKLALIELMQDRAGPFYDPVRGLRMIREVREKFPMNPLFQYVEIVYLAENRKAEQAQAEAKDFLKGIKEGRKFYHPRYAPRAYVALGTAHALTKDWAKAEEAFSEAVAILERQKGHNRWGLWALIRRGQSRDIRGDRAGASADYRRALEHLDYWDIHDLAKLHLKRPATEKDLVETHMAPP